MKETDFKQKLETFLNEYIAEKVNDIRKQNKELVEQKAALAEQLQHHDVFWEYEELETEYITLLTTGIYKQAMRDFHFFIKHYLK